MSAREVLVDTPAWEIDLLVQAWNAEQKRSKQDAERARSRRR
jgi:hypothetical protein